MSSITAEQKEQFHELGYYLTDPVFSDGELTAAAEAFDALHADAIAAAEKDGDERTVEYTRTRPFIAAAHAKSPVLARIVKKSAYLDACREFVGEDADLYYNQCVIKVPEVGKSFAWHQDSGYARTDPLAYITCWTAISRTFVDNGCIWVIPGSQKWGLLEHRRNEGVNALEPVFPDGKNDCEAIPVEMAPGQVAVFSSLTLHKSGENISDEIRRGYVPQYHVPGVIRVDTGNPWGDQFPVLRAGSRV